MSFETPPRPRWLLRVSLALGTVLALALGVVVVVGLVQRCDTGVWHAGDEGECVGVTDGSFPFSSELADVEDKIRQENERVAQEPEVVTVAVLMPMTAEPGASLSIEQINDYLRGAYIAQLSANAGGPGLKFRLALANEGRDEHASEQVTDELLKMVDEPENLVAVTGLGLSSPETEKGARKLSAAGIPMVGYLSADRFNSTSEESGPPIKGLTRVSPSLHQELEAVAEHLGDPAATAILVHDESRNDYYTADLQKNFEDTFSEIVTRTGSMSAPYGGGSDAFGLDTQFGTIASRLCSADAPRTVLYAGRSNLLPKFMEQISNRGCIRDRPITVVTGSESTDLPKNENASAAVLYASVSDPTALRDQRNLHRDLYLRFTGEMERRFGGNVRESNWTVMGHDATYAAVTAAKNSVSGVRTVPTPGGVHDNLFLLNHPTNLVSGASGRFMLDGDSGDRIGDIPVLRRDKTGHVEVLDLGGLDD
ncbi:hypothetical protein GCM10027271_54320 [Saccharopolyspora gloriosae]|uniref:ABC transporter substrate-binding protein n=1 Tax=Saccharopolyspora gloriosae TaxID=455344 RepID=UPI00160DF987|nr:ABC transporter substrate-binding protein [Saccharopolyspora gloriosae]